MSPPSDSVRFSADPRLRSNVLRDCAVLTK